MSLAFEHLTFTPAMAIPGAPPVLSDVSFTIARGAYVLISGASGAGKSTLLRLACRLEVPDSGRIIYNGRDVESYPPPLLRRLLAYIPQVPAVIPGTVRDNLLLPFSFAVNKGMPQPTETEMAERLARFHLDPALIGRNADNLSVGQKQRICLIRTLLTTPETLLMDEPTSALDAESAETILHETAHLNREHGITVMVITHSNYQPAFAHQLLMIKDGRVRLT